LMAELPGAAAGAACAHLHVEHERVEHGDGNGSGRWQCRDCRYEFVPVYVREELAKTMEELQKARRLLRAAYEFREGLLDMAEEQGWDA